MINGPGATKFHGGAGKDFGLMNRDGFLLLWRLKGLNTQYRPARRGVVISHPTDNTSQNFGNGVHRRPVSAI